MTKFNTPKETISSIIKDYQINNLTQKDLSVKYNISIGKICNILKAYDVQPNRSWRHGMSDESKLKISKAHKGKIISEEQKEIISKRNCKNLDGLHKYGYTKKHTKGYIQAYAPLHPKANKGGRVMLHTILMEQHIGRYLTDDEVVHHINHIRDDNRIENLQLMTKHEHMHMHMIERHKGSNKRIKEME